MKQDSLVWLILFIAVNAGCGDQEPKAANRAAAGESGSGEAGATESGGAGAAGEEQVAGGGGSTEAGARGEEQVAGHGGSTEAGAAGQAETTGAAGSGELGCGAASYDHDGDPDTACQSWTKCEPGQEVVEDGTPTSDRFCRECPWGSFSRRQNADSCTDWSACPTGTFVETSGTTTSDQICSDCPTGTFTSIANEPQCRDYGTCPTGTFVEAPGTASSDQSCSDCSDGTMSTIQNAESCTEWTPCLPGQYVSSAGTNRTDRTCLECPPGTFTGSENLATCEACPDGTFAALDNASACIPWSVDCPAGTIVQTPPSATSDRLCADCQFATFSSVDNSSSCENWRVCDSWFEEPLGTPTTDAECVQGTGVRQFGTAGDDAAHGVAIDSSGNVYVVGATSGTFDGENARGGMDAFVRKYDSQAQVVWTRQFGTAADDIAKVVLVAGSGDVYVAGDTGDALEGTGIGGQDMLVRRYVTAQRRRDDL